MNVFEDLVVELKEENLLENTVIESLALDVDFGEPPLGRETDFLRTQLGPNDPIGQGKSDVGVNVPAKPVAEIKRPPKKKINNSESPKQYSEVSAVFQVVEHILTAVERQSTGSSHAGFDDLRVNKALHRLAQASADPASGEYVEAQNAVDDEISAWSHGLATRDAEISVSQLRQYCETCQPALSSQALFSLARFYYELPYSDSVRSKFDFVLTKLFTRPSEGGQRQLICPRSEVVSHLSSRFVGWKREAAFASEDQDSVLNSLSCDDFVAEAENAVDLDELITSNFFARIRMFKQNSGDNFFSPSLAASVIECNVSVGNKLVTLLQAESKKLGSEQLKEKIGFLERDSFESTANRTFDLDEVLKAAAIKREKRKREPSAVQSAMDKELVDHKVETSQSPVEAKESETESWLSASFRVNKWLLIIGTVAVAISVGLYLWADRMAGDLPTSNEVKIVDLENSSFKEFVKDGRVSSETFYGISTIAWDRLSKEEKQDVLTKVLRAGVDSGYKRVSLINSRGKTVGFATGDHIEIPQP